MHSIFDVLSRLGMELTTGAKIVDARAVSSALLLLQHYVTGDHATTAVNCASSNYALSRYYGLLYYPIILRSAPLHLRLQQQGSHQIYSGKFVKS